MQALVEDSEAATDNNLPATDETEFFKHALSPRRPRRNVVAGLASLAQGVGAALLL